MRPSREPRQSPGAKRQALERKPAPAAQQIGQVPDVAGMQLIAGLRADVLDVGRAKLERALNVSRAQTTGPGGLQVVMVGGAKHHFARRQIEHLRHTQVGGRVGLVGPEHLGRQHAVPGQARSLGHVGQQAEVAIGQGVSV